MLVAVILCGAGSAWGEETFTYTFASKDWHAQGNDQDWTSGKDGNQFTKGRGIQVTTSASGANGTSPASFSNVSKIVVTYSTNASAGAGSISVQVGGGTPKSQNVTKTGGTTDRTLEYTFDTAESGNIKLTVTCTTNSIYVKGVTITYSEGGTQTVATPTFSPAAGTYTSAQDVTISCETQGATIYYSYDNQNWTAYTSALNIDETKTVYAKAEKDGMNNSAVSQATYTINLPYSGPDYVRINSLDDLTDGAKVIIAARHNTTATSYYAMTAAASGKPTGVAFTSTTSSNGEILPATIVDSESTYAWTVGVTADGYTFTNSNGEALGYTSSTNFAEGGDNIEWTISRATSGNSAMVSGYEGFYIVNKNNTGRGIALNNSYNYGPYATSNNTSSEYNFYVDIFVQGFIPSTDPTISANNVNIAYNAIAGNIDYTLSNPVTGTALTAAVTDGNWLTLGTIGETSIPFTCSANEEQTARTATVTLTYGSLTKTVTVTQAAAPLIYSTIPALFAAATSTSTPVTVTFDNWVVTGVNGNQVFVTDGTNGFIMYEKEHGFEVGNTLSGTVSCNLVLFNGSAEITGLTSGTEGLTVEDNGSVSPVTTTIDALNAVNTGSVVTLSNLTYNGTVLSDGTNTIQLYTSLYDDASCESGKTYNVTGVFVLNKTDKRILPRGANDIEEVSSVTPDTDGKYVKVTSTDALTSGQYLIVYEDGNVAFDGGLETLDAASNTISVTIANNEIAVTNATAAAEFTIDVTAGTIKSASGYYIGRTGDSNGMNSSLTEAYTNTLSIDADGNAVIVSSEGAYLRYNANSGQYRFRYFKSSSYTGQKAIQLYKKVEAEQPITVTVGPALYTTFVASAAVSFPSSVTAYIVTAINASSMHMEEKTAVPAGTAVVVKAAAADTYVLPRATETDDVTENKLQASTGNTFGDGSTIYALGVGKTGTPEAGIVGFYKVKSGSKVPAGKAYLVVSSSNPVKEFIAFDFGGTDAINAIDNGQLTVDSSVIYNVAGQRVGKMTKGIYVVNGKKVIVK